MPIIGTTGSDSARNQMKSCRFTRNSFSSDSSGAFGSDQPAANRPRSGYAAAFDLQSELWREEESSTPGSIDGSSTGQEQSFAYVLRRSAMGANMNTTLLEAQPVLQYPLEGREALENQNQDFQNLLQ